MVLCRFGNSRFRRICSLICRLSLLLVISFVVYLIYPKSEGLLMFETPSSLTDFICGGLSGPPVAVQQNKNYQKYETSAKQRFKLKSNCPGWNTMTELIRMQIESDLIVLKPTELHKYLVTIIERHTWTFRSILPMNYVRNNDETKPFIAFPDSKSCNIVTIGIGNDISAEEQILAKFPQCQFVGADPMVEFGQLYSRIGRYYPVAISDKSINRTSVVLWSSTNLYKYETVQHISLTNFLLNYAKMEFVDLLLLDGEGAEYDILPMLKKGGTLESSGVVICQISIELHTPLSTYSTNRKNEEWPAIVSHFLLNSDYLPIFAYKLIAHYRVFLINTRDSKCVEKYFSQFC